MTESDSGGNKDPLPDNAAGSMSANARADRITLRAKRPKKRNALINAVIIAASLTLFGNFLWFGYLNSKSDINCTLNSPSLLICTSEKGKGSIVSVYDLVTQEMTERYTLRNWSLGQVYRVDGIWYATARYSTPRNRDSVQVVRSTSYSLDTLELLNENSESIRHGLSMIGNQPAYLKSRNYTGPFAGSPWSLPYEICMYVGEEEQCMTTISNAVRSVTVKYSSDFYAYSQYSPDGNFLCLFRISKQTTSCFSILGLSGNRLSPSSAAQMGDNEQMIVTSTSFNASSMVVDLNLLDIETEQIRRLATFKGRFTDIFHSDTGDIYLLDNSPQRLRPRLVKVEGNELVHVISL